MEVSVNVVIFRPWTGKGIGSAPGPPYAPTSAWVPSKSGPTEGAPTFFKKDPTWRWKSRTAGFTKKGSGKRPDGSPSTNGETPRGPGSVLVLMAAPKKPLFAMFAAGAGGPAM